MVKPILAASSLVKYFDKVSVVNDLSFDIMPGEIFGLLGPNGAGKTTTISMLCGLLKASEGEVLIDGHSISSSPLAARRVLGIVPQEIALYENMTALENLHFWGRMYGLKGEKLQSHINDAMAIVDIGNKAKERVSSYSGGMKRRLNIAVGLLHKPKIVIMDEPTVGIDMQSRRHILNTIKRLNDEGLTVLYTTHHLEEAEELSHRIGIIDKGKLIALGDLNELIQIIGSQDTIEFQFEETIELSSDLKAILTSRNDISKLYPQENGIKITVSNGNAILSELIQIITELHTPIKNIKIVKPNLESVFLHLTGRALRD